MTEYDYSPEAYERHMATQQRIGNWVDQTLQYEPVNPFLPMPSSTSTGESHGEDYFSSSSSSRRKSHASSRASSSLHSRRYPTEYQTHAPNPGMQHLQMPYGSPYPSVDYSHSSSNSRHHDHSKSRTSSSRRSSKPIYVHAPPSMSWVQAPGNLVTSSSSYLTPHRPSPQSSSHSYSHSSYISSPHSSYPSTPLSSPQSSSGYRSLSSPLTSASSFGQSLPYTTIYPNPTSPTIIDQPAHTPVVVPINGGQGGYIVVAPKGKRMEVANPNYGWNHSEKRQPFFKKMLSPFKSRR